jgi:GNAT superfamily N-acetyltransferase
MDTQRHDLIDQNYVIAYGLLTSTTIIGEFYNSYKISMFNTGVANRQFNVAFVKDSPAAPIKLVHRWELFFEARGLPFRVSFRPGLERKFISILLEKGYREAAPEPVMILDDLPDAPPPHPNLDIQRVTDLKALTHFQEVIEKSYMFETGAGPYIITERTHALPNAQMFVGYAEGQPVCASMLIKTGPVAGIYWVATLTNYRGLGFGKSITLQAAAAGKKLGCEFASLQATSMGKPMYKSLGFDNPYSYISLASP